MKHIVIISFLMVSNLTSYGQEKSKFGIKFSGFIKNDFFYDTRQTIAAREGHFLLWPSPERLDEYGNDINAKANFNFLAIQSRIKGTITGPDAFGAKTSGVIEGDFFAQLNANINLFRLRHAYIKLSWTNLKVLTGQYWNPLFVTDCFPGTISFNTGTPFQSFARNPQIRVTYNISGFKIIAAALAQRDYPTWGIAGPSSRYLRNSAVPDMHLQLHYGSKKDNSGLKYVLGGGIAFKSIVPRLESKMDPANDIYYKINEKVHGLTAMGFAKINTKPITIKLQARYGENISDILAISGFAVKEITNATTGEQSYTPLKSMSVWGEVHTNGKIQFGIFGGYFKNLGTKDPMADTGNNVYGLATDINSLFRISPRVSITSGKVRVALELEYTAAAYGNDFNLNYIPANTTKIANLRTLLALCYFF